MEGKEGWSCGNGQWLMVGWCSSSTSSRSGSSVVVEVVVEVVVV